MLFHSQMATSRPGYIDVVPGVAVEFRPDAQPEIQWRHIDGPLLYLRSGELHWLTLWERFQCWVGYADAFTLERKHAPDFVRRWEDRLRPVTNPFVGGKT